MGGRVVESQGACEVQGYDGATGRSAKIMTSGRRWERSVCREDGHLNRMGCAMRLLVAPKASG
jgi:hypothetical protein